MRFFREVADFLGPAEVPLRPPLEREDSEFARVSATLERIEKHRERVSAEFRDPVSSKYKYVEPYLEQLESFADRLIRENVAKQSETDIVARNIRRFNNRMLADLGYATFRKQRAPGFDARAYDDAWHASRRSDDIPRTVFGTDAWIGRPRRGLGVGRRFMHAAHLNPRFVTKLLALPCVERSVRKEVMFAKGKAGVGYRKPHRPSKFSDIWC